MPSSRNAFHFQYEESGHEEDCSHAVVAVGSGVVGANDPARVCRGQQRGWRGLGYGSPADEQRRQRPQLTPGIKVESVTDDAPGGSNVYKRVDEANSSCAEKPIEIWYCEKCKAGVNELKFHLSAHTQASINVFLEVSNLSQSLVLDGAAHVSDAVANAKGLEPGPRIVTTATDFVIARFVAKTRPTGVTPETWTYKTSYVYGLNMPAGTHQPTLTGGKAGDSFCMSMAAFKTAVPVPAAK